MNDAIAQLVGAGIGLAGAVVGGLATRSGARAQAQGQVIAAQLQIRSVQDEALWASRRAAVVEFVAAVDRFSSTTARRAAVARTLERLAAPDAFADAENLAIAEENKVRIADCTAALAAVKLAVPEFVSNEAVGTLVSVSGAHNLCGDWVAAIYDGLPGAQVVDAREAYRRGAAIANGSLNTFTNEARLYLERRADPVGPVPRRRAWWRR